MGMIEGASSPPSSYEKPLLFLSILYLGRIGRINNILQYKTCFSMKAATARTPPAPGHRKPSDLNHILPV
jgi:hypothetical protein